MDPNARALLDQHRSRMRANTLADEASLLRRLVGEAGLDPVARRECNDAVAVMATARTAIPNAKINLSFAIG